MDELQNGWTGEKTDEFNKYLSSFFSVVSVYKNTKT